MTVVKMQFILELVKEEFGDLAKHFVAREFAMNNLAGTNFEQTKTAGVYVFWHNQYKYVKVGKSQSNASKRALEHVRDNTQTKMYAQPAIRMQDFKNDPNCKLIIFNIDELCNMHWLLALEHFLEHKLKPAIPSKRSG